MPDIVLATLNAKYLHAAFGLRYLRANLGELRERSVLAEFDINQRPLDIAERILAFEPRIVGLGVYIWNATPTTELVALLKRIRPEVRVILGGPEVSHETAEQPIVALADHVITGEADLKFAEVCRALLGAADLRRSSPLPKIIPAELPDLGRLALPYDEYTDDDIAHRLIYVEASRGCPFECEFCLSALDVPVRAFPLEPFLAAMDRLLARGVRQFKFVDRTFNLHLGVSRRILEFFLERLRPDLFLHFEMIPDRLPTELRELIARFPPGTLQFEVGIQTFNPEVADLIHRRQHYDRVEDNLRFLRQHTTVHVHADLIAGLPGETLASFAAGFDRLVALGPHEIQVGILKRLRGAPIARHDHEWEMVYSPLPPYEILRHRLIGFADMQRLRRFARFWDLVANSGQFVETTPLIWDGCQSPFAEFLRFSEWLHQRAGRTHAIALPRLTAFVAEYLTDERRLDPRRVAEHLHRDGQRTGGHELPPSLRPWLPEDRSSRPRSMVRGPVRAARQRRHRGAAALPVSVGAVARPPG
ncbi:MAG: DUF4080 domain-containing protein [Verrucomicrobia bacterium]|jgi:radical SAM superfamily enzyme YgiQ (UPF0313 family)|nr:DUF4080 domain-containing protein [Verrucomicrobiota bacterium]